MTAVPEAVVWMDGRAFGVVVTLRPVIVASKLGTIYRVP